MKALTYSLFAAAAACCFASAQTTAYTTPVGYVTKSLAPSQFTLVGLTVHNPTKSAGVISGETATSVTVSGVDFVALLGTPGSATYILELPDGTVQEISSWTATGDLSTPDNITAVVVPGTTTYKLRKAATVTDIFGATNSFGLTPTPDGDPATADKILVPNAANSFDTVFYFNDGAGTEGWLDAEGNLAADKILPYPDGMYIQRVAGSSINLVVSGEVKLDPTGGALVAGFNYLNAVAPTGVTLAESGLKDYISQSSDGDPGSVDNIQIQTPSGTYTTAFYYNDGAGTEGWLDSEGNLAGDYVLDGGFLILNRGGVKPYSVDVPPAYSSL